MKKILIIAMGMAVTIGAAAQTWQDALLFSENNYGGTARSVGIGNALTAVGGDAGSIGINPAGSSVASYSQFVFTPGVTFSTVNVAGTIAEGSAEAIGLGDKVKTPYSRFRVPNVGFIINMNTGRRSGWKRMSFGFMFNSTADYTSRLHSSGVNYDNSFAASLASQAQSAGYKTADLSSSDWYNTPAAWMNVAGYRSGMFDGLPGQDGSYIAVTEVIDDDGNIRLAAPVFQKYGQQTTGSKHDILMNFSANYNDMLYLGLNLGVTTLSYGMSEYWMEMPDNPDEFPTLNYDDGRTATFESLTMKRNYQASGSGIYLKAGAIWRPMAGLRLGAAIQTPTLMDIKERYGFSGTTVLSGKSTTIPSPEDELGYTLVNPFRFNLGVAYSIGSWGLVSADYEFADYSHTHYKSSSSYAFDDNFADVNADIAELLGVSHQLRLGAEVKPLPFLAVRAGYNYIGSGQSKYFQDNYVYELSASDKAALSKHSASLGLGFSSGGSFFADAAVRVRFMPKDYLIPYLYYADGAVDGNVLTPEIEIKSRMVDALVTVGWRF